jgi:GABA permease
MIAIGGVIGAGLFVGSGAVINETGPAAFLTYAITGVLIVLVMRMLGEMATANPSTGLVRRLRPAGAGRLGGLLVGWLYWYFWVIVVGFEAVAGAKILHVLARRPAVAACRSADAADDGDEPVLGLLLRGVRVLVRRHQGRRDHRLPRARHAVRARALAGRRSTSATSPPRRLLPNGVGAIFSGIVVVIFSMVGAEIATIAAAESPTRSGRSPRRRTR